MAAAADPEAVRARLRYLEQLEPAAIAGDTDARARRDFVRRHLLPGRHPEVPPAPPATGARSTAALAALDLALLHGRRADDPVAHLAGAFFAECRGEALDQVAWTILAEARAARIAADSRAVASECAKVAGRLDYAGLPALLSFLDIFLLVLPDPENEAGELVLDLLRQLRARRVCLHTAQSHPALARAMETLGRYEAAKESLFRIARRLGPDLPDASPHELWRTLLELLVLHCLAARARGLDGMDPAEPTVSQRELLPGLLGPAAVALDAELETMAAERSIHFPLLEAVARHLGSAARAGLFRRASRICRGPAGLADDPWPRQLARVLGLGPEAHGEQAAAGGAPPWLRPAGALEIPWPDREPLRLRLDRDGWRRLGADEPGPATAILAKDIAAHPAGVPLETAGWRVLPLPDLAGVLLQEAVPALRVSGLGLRVKERTILEDVSFVARSGELFGICGVSGCGKTSLLMALAGMVSPSTGAVSFGGRPLASPRDCKAATTYVPQEDLLFPELTVRESVALSGRLRLRGTAAERGWQADSLLRSLELEAVAAVRVGDMHRKGISGGQRRRTHIGAAIAGGLRPVLLFDEPTTGLDPSLAEEVERFLRELSRRGHVVLVVTHDLHERMVGLFDRLLVLDRGGRACYAGPPALLREHFPIRDPEDLFEVMEQAPAGTWARRYAESSLAAEVRHELEPPRPAPAAPPAPPPRAPAVPGFLDNFATFLGRDLLRKSRDRQFLLACLLQPLVIGAILVLDFAGPLPNLLFSMVISCLWIGAIYGAREINGEWATLRQERRAGVNLAAYTTAKVACGLVFSALQVGLLVAGIALLEGFGEPPFNFPLPSLLGVFLLLAAFGLCLGLLLSSLLRSTLTSVVVLPVLLIPLLVKGGLLYRHDEAAGLSWWVMKLNPVRAGFESAMFRADAILGPKPLLARPRSQPEAAQMAAEWGWYQQKKRLFEADPAAYKERHGERSEDDRILDSVLAGAKGDPQALLEPVPPVDLQDPLLLQHRPDLWRAGFTLLAVEKPLPGASPWRTYAVTVPDLYSGSPGAQGLLGMFQPAPGDGRAAARRARSVYAPAEYSLLVLAETLLLAGLTLLALHLRLDWRKR